MNTVPNNDKEILEENLEDVENTEETSEETAEAQAVENEDENTSSESDETEDDAVESDGEESKTFAEKRAEKKKAKADKKQDALKEKIDELEDKVKRQMAEFDNFRKRTEKEKTQMFETGAKSVIEKILPVVDNFERGLASVPEEEKGKGFADGMNMIYKQLMNELANIGVTPIEAVGQEFNPDFHNAVMQVESDEYESGVVAQELQKGYMYRDTVVRHSMVAVVQ
ncbi:MAG: nucleotide exchange factor GrpE [Lachnospiraceae bacterium]|nr:nucleotide exchange factor GrpE [Lachnospiraceae bacterium]